MTNLAGKNVILTGAAGGLGRHIGQRLSQAGAKIIAVDLDQLRLESFCQTIGAMGGEVTSLAWDLSKVASLADLITTIEDQSGPVDILINNAGLASYLAFEDCSLEHLQKVLSVNLLAAMELTRLLVPRFLERQQGHIVNIASLAAKKGHPYDSVYSASKAGLLMWSDSMRQEWLNRPIKISVVCPGYIDQAGMFAKTELPAPKLSGISHPSQVAAGVIRAIEGDRAEVIVNQNLFYELPTKLLLAVNQLLPTLGDSIWHSLGVGELNRQRAEANVRRQGTIESLEVTKSSSH